MITTAVPFLSIASDARSAGMGDLGVASSPDAFSQQWNAAKFAFIEGESAVHAGYTPYLESLVDGVSLLGAGYYNKINDRSAFSLG